METKQDEQTGDGVDIEINGKKQEVKYSLTEIQAMQVKAKEQAKAKAKAIKAKDKAKAESEKYSDDNIAILIEEEELRLQSEGAELAASLAIGEEELATMQSEVQTINNGIIGNKAKVRNIKGQGAYHKNSPKVPADSPYSYAIPRSIIETTLLSYPGQFGQVFKDGKSIRLECKARRIEIDYSDPHIVKARNGYGKADPFKEDYTQGIKKSLTKWLAKHMPKKAA